MGASGSKEKLLNSLPETGERFYGLENFGNTCYANSVRVGPGIQCATASSIRRGNSSQQPLAGTKMLCKLRWRRSQGAAASDAVIYEPIRLCCCASTATSTWKLAWASAAGRVRTIMATQDQMPVARPSSGCRLSLPQVLQTLYSCQPFRDRLLQYAAGPATRDAEETILSCLADLFVQVIYCSHPVSTAAHPHSTPDQDADQGPDPDPDWTYVYCLRSVLCLLTLAVLLYMRKRMA